MASQQDDEARFDEITRTFDAINRGLDRAIIRIADKLKSDTEINRLTKGQIYVADSDESFANYLERRDDIRYRRMDSDWESDWK